MIEIRHAYCFEMMLVKLSEIMLENDLNLACLLPNSEIQMQASFAPY